MNPKLLAVLPTVFLLACATPSTKDDAPASDLDALEANVRKTTRPTLLPNGKEYCAEIAKTSDEQDACMGDLEDALYNGNRKGESTYQTVTKFIARERLRRNPCTFWEKVRFAKRCQ